MAKVTKAEQTIIDLAMKRLKIAVEAEQENRTKAVEDLLFIDGDQWPEEEKNRRSIAGRPALTINMLPKFIDQVHGDMLQNTPQIKVRPSDTTGDSNIAKIRQALISEIEYSSNAIAIYGNAGKQMVACGYGAWRVLTRYSESNPFTQEIYLEAIKNPLLAYMDPSSKDPSYSDAKWGFVLEKIPVDEFKERYPKANCPSSVGDFFGVAKENWFDGDTVTVAEYFVKDTESVDMILLNDGRVINADELESITTEWETQLAEITAAAINGIPPKGPMSPKPEAVRAKTVERTVIKQWILTASDMIEGGTEGNVVAGEYIPVVLLRGKELNIEGKTKVYSLIRHGKDPQKMLNYWNSAAAETIALAPKSPWIGTAKQFEGYENDYASANVDNIPFLKYNSDPEAQGPPQRVSSANPPTAIFEQIRRGEENIKAVVGMFNADVGAPDSRQTGAAVIAGQKPGDIGTYEFVISLNRAVLHTGKIINSMIPKIYDTERDIRVRNIDESESFVPINTTVGSALEKINSNPEMFEGMDATKLQKQASTVGDHAKFNDISSGKYDVILSTGPNYATQRQESSQLLMQLAQAMPQQMAAAADLIVENMDFKAADELARRLRMPLVAQGIIQPRPGDPQPQPQGPSAEEKIQEALIEVEKSKVQVNELKAQNEQTKLQLTNMELQVKLAQTQAGLERDKIQAIQSETKEMRSAQIDEAKLKREMMKMVADLRKDETALANQSASDPLKIRKRKKAE